VSHKRTVGIFIFDAVEVLDFCGPFEVFASASAPTGEPSEDDEHASARLFDVRIIAEERRIVSARGGLRVEPHHGIDDCPPLDVLLVPGGFGTRPLMFNQRVLDWIAAQNERVETMTSVCTGALVYADAGLLDGRPATTHWGSLDQLARLGTGIEVRPDDRFVDDGDVITAAGVSAGIDVALHLVARLHSKERAAEVRRFIQYDPEPPV